MPRSATRDFMVGVFVLAGLASIGYLSVQLGGLGQQTQGGLTLVAEFDNVGGLKVRAPVEIAGVPVGRVEQIGLGKDLRARVIRTAGLLGDQFISLEPGAEEKDLRSGDVISYTEGAISLDKLIGAVVHGGGDLGSGK
jgi:phospholipid/cholesterol/gamma-HCH transport system substrate-binding protein